MILGFSISNPVLSEDSHEHHDHEAHVHGHANLYVVVDDKNVFIEFESPAMNLLGFEHEPHNEDEHKAVASVNEALMDYKTVVMFPNSQCEQVEVEMEMPYEAEEHEDHHDHHAHEEKHEHKHEHEESEHSDYFVSYAFECNQAISTIELVMFEDFPVIEKVEVNWVSESKQGAFFAKPDKNLLEID